MREHDSVTGDTFEYSGYFSVGNEAFPRTLRLVNSGGRQLLKLQVNSIKPLSAAASAGLFLPVKGAMRITPDTPCTEIRPAKRTKMVEPTYPPSAKEQDRAGTVVLHAVIGTDGRPHALKVAHSAFPLLSAAAMEAVLQWRYTPAVCVEPGGGRFIPSKAPIRVVFTLEP